jgi:hypothetical protein
MEDLLEAIKTSDSLFRLISIDATSTIIIANDVSES